MLHDCRIVNLRLKVCGYTIDAAIDCDWCLHCYDIIPVEIRPNTVPVELYCLECPDWDIDMVYFAKKNDPHTSFAGGICHTIVDLEDIRKAARKWVRRMSK